MIAVESEWKTRKKRIDTRLEALGWKVVPYDASLPLTAYHLKAVEEYPTVNGPADYALVRDGNIVGIIEAKKLTLGPQSVLTQAERYARGATDNPLRFREFYVPFLYSTNGEVIWFCDVRHPLYRSRQVANFHTPNALQEMLKRDFEGACEWFANNPNRHPKIRPYQIEANKAIEEAIASRTRQMLVAMATGTGKTFTTVNQVARLMQANVAKRVLFLVDRRALAAQAVRAFASFEIAPGVKFSQAYEVYSQRFSPNDFGDEPFDTTVLPASYLTDPQPGHTFVYVATIQRMMINLFGKSAAFDVGDEPDDDDAEPLAIPVHAFDVIVADECHRGYNADELAVWRRTLQHFDAIKIGLTATPAAHTTAFFQNIVYRYGYERAVKEGHLVDYDVVSLKSDVRVNGVFLKEGEQVGTIDAQTGTQQFDYLEDERQFAAEEIENKVTSPDSNRKILEEINRYALEHEQEYGRFPKILIFADNDIPHTSHADQIVDIARDVFGRGDSFVRKITGRIDRPLQQIKAFRNRPEPGVVVSVDMLTTGVDIPDLEYIVFLRRVKSRILFEQMLGRGTRKGEKFPDKSHFTVFDCFDGTLIKYFREATGMTVDPPAPKTKPITQVIEDIWQNKDRKYNVGVLVKRLQRIDKEMSGEARDKFAPFVADGDLAKYAETLPELLKNDLTGAMKTLRDPKFQHLLLHYPRPEKTFIVAVESEDTVSSEWLVRGADGKEYKPQDYLAVFAQFVQENEAQIEAIRILHNRPAGWNTDALRELRDTLKNAPPRFTEENLRKAHQITYRKALVDLISMVKHAVREEEPLLTAEERVRHAMQTVASGRTFTPEQQRWWERIHAHLVENLTIEQDDFDLLPVLSGEGGWTPANRAFGGHLAPLLQQINEAIAT